MSLAPLSTAPPRRGDVSPSDFSQGCILFIKKREHVLDTHLRSSGIEEEGLRHPALVIQKEGLRDSQIIICPVGECQDRLPLSKVGVVTDCYRCSLQPFKGVLLMNAFPVENIIGSEPNIYLCIHKNLSSTVEYSFSLLMASQ